MTGLWCWQDIGEEEIAILAQKEGENACYIDTTGNVLKQLDYAVERVYHTYYGRSSHYDLFNVYGPDAQKQGWIIAYRSGSPVERVLTRVDRGAFTFSGQKGDGWYDNWDCNMDTTGLLLNVQSGGKMGFVAAGGAVITNPDWLVLSPFNQNGSGFVWMREEAYRLIDTSGAYLGEGPWKNVMRMSEDFLRFYLDDDSNFNDMGGYSVSAVLKSQSAEGERVWGYINDRGEYLGPEMVDYWPW